MNRRATRPSPSRPAWAWPVFLALSLAIHATAAVATRLTGPAATSVLAFEPSPRALSLAGDTLDVEPAPPPPASDPVEAPGETHPAAPAPARPSVARTPGPASAPVAASVAPPPLFGAVGVKFASDLATTFTRAFPQAASADPVWAGAAFGSTSSAEITLALDEDGYLAQTVVGGTPSLALRRGIDRTLALLGARPFTARGAVTRLRVTAHVSRDEVHDGLHGDVFALSGGSFSGDVGSAFFALPPVAGAGRRIDVELRLLP